MEYESLSELEKMIIFAGSFFLSSGTVANIDKEFLYDLNDLIVAELERREAVIH